MNKLVPVALFCGVTASAYAQTPTTAKTTDDSNDLQQVVVTGTLIRGVAPTGTPIQTVDSAAIAATGTTNTAELLATVPAFTSFNTLPVGGNQEFRSTGATVPGMRGLPGTAVLVLLDGHRLPGDSPLLTTADPSSIPAGAIDHVEVLTDGGSATYGSDAVAGVVNIILKKHYDGAETTVSYGGANAYNDASVMQTFGKTWSTGSAILSASYQSNSALLNSDRSFYTQNLEPFGGKNALSNTCGPAKNILIGNQYYTANTLRPEPATALQTCDPFANADLVNPNRRYALVGNVRQDVGDRVHLFLDYKYTDNYSSEAYAPTTFSGVVIPNTNPFFQAPAGSTATSETVLVNSGALGAIGAVNDIFRARSGMVDFGTDVDLGHNWQLTADFDYGWSNSSALNPTSSGPNPNALAAAENGTTTATALDPFNLQTNPTVARAIMNWPLLFAATQRIYDFNVKADGTLFTLPGGDVKLAVGAANRHEQYSGDDPIGVPGEPGFTQPNAQAASREVNAIFSELSLPIVGPNNEVPGIHRLSLSAAGRYDHYSDFGGTKNPKYGIVWSPIEDVSLRATYGTSFHAPQLADINAIDTRGTLSQSTASTILPPGLNPGVYTIGIAGGKPGLLPETAKTASFGVDFTPTFLKGFKANLTYFLIRYNNEVEIPPNSQEDYLIPSLAGQVVHDNLVNGVYEPLTPAQLQSALGNVRQTWTGGLTGIPPVYLITDLRRTNLGATDIDGWDFDLRYSLPAGPGSLMFELSGEYLFLFKTQLGVGTPFINNLTSGDQYYQNDAGAQSIIPWHVRFLTGWGEGGFNTQVALNYTGHYNYGYSAYNYNLIPPTTSAALQWVSPFVTVDWTGSYDLPYTSGIGKGLRVQLNVYNVLNQAPPLELVTGASGGFASESANPLGRYIKLTLNKSW